MAATPVTSGRFATAAELRRLPAQPLVRVGLVSWNTAGLLDRCLAALPAALQGVGAEIVVVDNASSDASAVAATHHGVTLLRNQRNVGYAKAMNQALAGTSAPVLIALNPDTEPPPGSLAALVDRLRTDPAVGLLSPRLVDGDGSPQQTARRFPSLSAGLADVLLPARLRRGRVGRRFLLEFGTEPKAPADVDWTVGAVHVIRAAALGGRTPYDERWFMYVEDLELCWWLAERGWRRRFEADIVVPHVGNASGDQAWGNGYRHRCLDATYDWYQRDVGRVSARSWAALNTLNAASRAAVGIVTHRRAEHVANLLEDTGYHARVALRGAPALGAGPPSAGLAGTGPSPTADRDSRPVAGQVPEWP